MTSRHDEPAPERTVWNPVRGCDPVGPGCDHCYAREFAERWRGEPGHPYEQGFDLRLVPHMLTRPFVWTKPREIQVASTSDLFHPGIDRLFLDRILRVVRAVDWQVFHISTRRSDRMREILVTRHWHFAHLPHVWFAVAAEDGDRARARINDLRGAPAASRALVLEPLLGDPGKLELFGIDWVIVGGEMGAAARPMDPDWVRKVRDQCEEQNIPFLFKRWGGEGPAAAERTLDGQVFDEMPAFATRHVPSRRERRMRMTEALELGEEGERREGGGEEGPRSGPQAAPAASRTNRLLARRIHEAVLDLP